MMVSKAQIRATEKYNKAKYFETKVRFPKEAEAIIRQKAGSSLNGYIVDLILKDCGYKK